MITNLGRENLGAMKSKTSKVFAWVIVVLLVLGLAGFGIQDVIRSSGSQEIALVGEQKISPDDFIRTIQQEINAISKQVGTKITFQQAKSFGVSQIALQKLLTIAILDQASSDLNISRSNKTLLQFIEKMCHLRM